MSDVKAKEYTTVLPKLRNGTDRIPELLHPLWSGPDCADWQRQA